MHPHAPRWPGRIATGLIVLAVVALVVRTTSTLRPDVPLPLPPWTGLALAVASFLAPWLLLVERARVDRVPAWKWVLPALLVTFLAPFLLPLAAGTGPSAVWILLHRFAIPLTLMYAAFAFALITVVHAHGARVTRALAAWLVVLVASVPVVELAREVVMENPSWHPAVTAVSVVPVVLPVVVTLRTVAVVGWPNRPLTALAALMALVGAAGLAFLVSAGTATLMAGNDPEIAFDLMRRARVPTLAVVASQLLAALALTIAPPVHTPGEHATALETRA